MKAIFILIFCIFLTVATQGQSITNPDFNHPGYKRPLNPFDQFETFWYECTRYVFGRAHEKTGIVLKFSENSNRHGGRWLTLVKDFPQGQEPCALSIAVFSGATYGHVAFVEYVDSSYIHISEANVVNKGKYDGVKKFTRDSIKKRGSLTLLGYIYLTAATPVQPVAPSFSFVSETHPDNTKIKAGQSVITGWKFKADAPVYVWRAVKVSGNLSPNSVVYLGANYNAGNTFDFRLSMKIPRQYGIIKETWQLQDRNGKVIPIGKSPTFWRQVNVVK